MYLIVSNMASKLDILFSGKFVCFKLIYFFNIDLSMKTQVSFFAHVLSKQTSINIDPCLNSVALLVLFPSSRSLKD